MNFDSESSEFFTQILETKESPFESAHGKSTVHGSVVTVILSKSNGSEISVKNTTKPISIRLNRLAEKQSKYEEHELQGSSFNYHKVILTDKQMTLSVYISPISSSIDTYGVYVSFDTNETILEPPTELKFDLVFIIPNKTAIVSTSNMNSDDEHESRHTIFLPPHVHFGNGTYIFGVKLISEIIFSINS